MLSRWQWLGDVYADPQLFEPGKADRKNLQSLYDKLSPVVRGNDPNRLVFYEPTVVISQVSYYTFLAVLLFIYLWR